MNVISYMIELHIFRETEGEPEFLLMKRSHDEIYPGIWQMVTGKIKEDEKAWETALRELKEETGLAPKDFWVIPFTNSFYSHEKDVMCMVPVFVVRVNSDSTVTLSKEHSEYKWVSFEEAKKELAWYGQRKSVDIINEYLKNERSTLEFIRLPV